MAANPVSVIIPTFNRRLSLLRCLQHLEHQTVSNFDVIVVDDGSTDETREFLAQFSQSSSLYLKVLHQSNSGPTRARNFALREASSPLCILIGDDILVAPDFVERHLEIHRANPEETVVVLGLTRWDTEHQELTPFMRWVEDIQFSYAELDAGTPPDWRYFYTSNLSFNTQLFLDYPFDETYQAAFDDMELGYRIQMAGKLSMRYCPEAFATHVHPTSFMSAARRMQMVGRAEAHFLQDHPEAELLFSKRHPLKQAAYDFLAKRPRLLDRLTTASNALLQERRPNFLISGLLMAHHRFGRTTYRKTR